MRRIRPDELQGLKGRGLPTQNQVSERFSDSNDAAVIDVMENRVMFSKLRLLIELTKL